MDAWPGSVWFSRLDYSLISLIHFVFRHTDTLYKSPVSKFPVPTFDEEVNIVQPMFLPFLCYRFMRLCERCLLTFEAWTYTSVSRCCTTTYQARPLLCLMSQSESCAVYVFSLLCYGCMAGFHVHFSICMAGFHVNVSIWSIWIFFIIIN